MWVNTNLNFGISLMHCIGAFNSNVISFLCDIGKKREISDIQFKSDKSFFAAGEFN